MKDIERWAKSVGLDTSAKKGQWEISVRIETSGELPGDFTSTKDPGFLLKMVPNGWWIVLSDPRGKRDVMMKAIYVSWYVKPERWKHEGKGWEKLEPPKSLATLREWLTKAEEKLGVKFRRDRPFIQSNVKGGAKAMAAWMGGAPRMTPKRPARTRRVSSRRA